MHVARHCVITQERLQEWEEVLDQLVERLAVLLDFKFKCLEETFERMKSRHFESFVALGQPVVDLLLGIL